MNLLRCGLVACGLWVAALPIVSAQDGALSRLNALGRYLGVGYTRGGYHANANRQLPIVKLTHPASNYGSRALSYPYQSGYQPYIATQTGQALPAPTNMSQPAPAPAPNAPAVPQKPAGPPPQWLKPYLNEDSTRREQLPAPAERSVPQTSDELPPPDVRGEGPSPFRFDNEISPSDRLMPAENEANELPSPAQSNDALLPELNSDTTGDNLLDDSSDALLEGGLDDSLEGAVEDDLLDNGSDPLNGDGLLNGDDSQNDDDLLLLDSDDLSFRRVPRTNSPQRAVPVATNQMQSHHVAPGSNPYWNSNQRVPATAAAYGQVPATPHPIPAHQAQQPVYHQGYAQPLHAGAVPGHPVATQSGHPQPVYGQPVYQQPPKMQPAYGQMLHGQVIQGQVIQGQPVQGQPTLAPPLQGSAHRVAQPVSGRMVQPASTMVGHPSVGAHPAHVQPAPVNVNRYQPTQPVTYR